jgi:hypothetical protein
VTRFCANCGTEVDDHAVFCPSCGQPIDQETEAEMPPAPSWPEPEPRAPQPTHEPADPDEPEPAEEPPPRDDRGWSGQHDRDAAQAEVTRVVEPQPGPDVEAAPLPTPGTPPPRANDPPPASRQSTRPAVDLRLTMPVTLSAWLIGGGAALGAIGALIALLDGLGTAIDLLLLVSLLAVAASVFLSDRLPNVSQLRLIAMSIVLVSFGAALDRLGFGRAGAGDLLLFLGTAAAAIGAIILETGRDQPLGGPSA